MFFFTLTLLIALPVEQQSATSDRAAPSHEGKRVNEWVKLLQKGNAEQRREAAGALGHIGPAAIEGLPALIVALKDEDEFVRQMACWAIEHFGPQAKAAVPTLMEVLKNHTDAIHGGHAANALGSIGPEARAAVPVLTADLKDSDSMVRQSAAFALAKIGIEAKMALPDLTKALQDEEGIVRVQAARALWEIARSKDALPVVLKDLKTRDAFSQAAAVHILDLIENEDDTILPAVREAMKDENLYLRAEAAFLLWKRTKDPEAIRVLIQLLREEEMRFRLHTQVVGLLGLIGPAAKEAAQEIEKS